MNKMNRRNWLYGFVAAGLLFLSVPIIQAEGESEPGSSQAGERVLPLSRLVLFSSGVGYFQRDGQVTGDTSLSLDFPAAAVNDLLKSMVLQDFDGGAVRGVTYSSRDPLTRTLKTFAVDLTGDPTLADILEQIRGEPVEVTASQQVRGTVVGVESRQAADGVTERYLNLLTDRGLRSLRLAELQEIRLVDPDLEAELRQALRVLAEGHSTDRKRVTLLFTGQGRRRVRVGYLLEAPVWKTSYRLVLGQDGSHFLQGWAIVENTTDEDWRSVRLTLASGQPISFVMDLYRPLYIRRPEVSPQVYGAVQPQRYEEGFAGAAPAPQEKGVMAPRAAPAPSMAREREPEIYEEEAMDLARGVSAAAQAERAGEFFQYVIDQSVSIPRQESAMLPIVSQEIAGRRVSIYNERVDARHPLNGLRLVNSTGLNLMAGPLTVFESGSYAGDALIDTLQAGAERLISFSVDLDTEVLAEGKSQPERLVSVRIQRGILTSTRLLRRERSYTIRNRGERARELLVEHPLDHSWKLVSPEAEERTREVYRFSVQVPAARGGGQGGSPGTAELSVVEERTVEQRVSLTTMSTDQIAVYLRADTISARIKSALQGLQERQQALAETVQARQAQEARLNQIHREQERIRQNMGVLDKDSQLYQRYLRELNTQENQLESILSAIEDLRTREQRQRSALADYVQSLDIS